MSLFQLPLREHIGRKRLRSLADALEALRESKGLYGSGDIEIKAHRLQLPDLRVTGLVLVLGPTQSDGTRWVIRMPSAATFKATSTLGARECCDIELLDGAVSDPDGNVQLGNGRYVHGVDFEPTPMRYDLTWNQRVVIHHAIDVLGVAGKCYRVVDQQHLPGEEWLDYGMLPTVRIRSVKRLQFDLRKRLPGVKDHFIALTLARAGFRFPRSSVERT